MFFFVFKLMYTTHEIGFGHFTYEQKEDEIKFSMAPVSGPTKTGFDQNCQNNFNI
jgi:hypothetical protein